MTRQAFVAWLMCASGVALAGTHVLVATQENSQIPPAARNYWAFKLPVQSAVPETATRADNPIDRFLEKTRRDKGLEPAPRASRLSLLRRAEIRRKRHLPRSVNRRELRRCLRGNTARRRRARSFEDHKD